MNIVSLPKLNSTYDVCYWVQCIQLVEAEGGVGCNYNLPYNLLIYIAFLSTTEYYAVLLYHLYGYVFLSSLCLTKGNTHINAIVNCW